MSQEWVIISQWKSYKKCKTIVTVQSKDFFLNSTSRNKNHAELIFPQNIVYITIVSLLLLVHISVHDWRNANVAPVYKKGDRHTAENYRPVSLTCVVSKLLEHIICHHILNHLDNNNSVKKCINIYLEQQRKTMERSLRQSSRRIAVPEYDENADFHPPKKKTRSRVENTNTAVVMSRTPRHTKAGTQSVKKPLSNMAGETNVKEGKAGLKKGNSKNILGHVQEDRKSPSEIVSGRTKFTTSTCSFADSSSKSQTNDPFLNQLNKLGFGKQSEISKTSISFRNSNRFDTVHSLQDFCTSFKNRIQLQKSLQSPIITLTKELGLFRTASPFDRRVTALEWHPTRQNILCVGSKGGDIFLWDTEGTGANGSCQEVKFWPWDSDKVVSASINGTVKLHQFDPQHDIVLADTMNSFDIVQQTLSKEIKNFSKTGKLLGLAVLAELIGEGGSCQAMKFWPWDCGKIITASINGRVTLHDIETSSENPLADTMNCLDLDVCASRYLIAAGRNNGILHMMSTEGRKVFEFRLHKNKITHVEFSPREDWLLCTASVDRTVQLWDVRNMGDRKHALEVLNHNAPVNAAYFSETDGCRLLTTDQGRELRVYRSPSWHLETKIEHPHRFFQHITPFKATWHPLQDLVVCGRYPDKTFPGSGNELRTVDVFDAGTGDQVSQIYSPGTDGLCPLSHKSGMLSHEEKYRNLQTFRFHVLLRNRKQFIEHKQAVLVDSIKSALGLPTSGQGERSNHSTGGQRSNPKTKKKKGGDKNVDDLKKKAKRNVKTKEIPGAGKK
ncbi:DDB2-like protein [Mya arenaria]|uniref:DNA damage-binding protein 2 n=1 Tax=Mya arenaria TaxID=6604 RepID=A0ABY7F427_MYAAR|nr:DDB2-like protein [Mya arenaria]